MLLVVDQGKRLTYTQFLCLDSVTTFNTVIFKYSKIKSQRGLQ